MVMLRCQGLVKKYPNQEAYSLGGPEAGVDLNVAEGELFALLGPSGCGKTTTLRIVAGFVEPTAGRVEVAGKDVTSKPPYARPTNTVFQNYALFPHLNVHSNVEFGLKMDRVPRLRRKQRANEVLEIVGMSELANRRISELSGGQQQRVALARALAKTPKVLLLDEPLGALDLRLRRQMQDELVRLKRSTGTTFVHVTHDQEEACAIADRIAVMNRGRIIQVDSPVELYRSPRTAFVARFLGVGTVIQGRSDIHGTVVSIATPDLTIVAPRPPWLGAGVPVSAVLPPDKIRIERSEPGSDVSDGWQQVEAVVEHVAFTGSAFDIRLRVGAGKTLSALVPGDGDWPESASGGRVSASWRTSDVLVVADDSATPESELSAVTAV
jgi:ABC-type Fe3+/spermidine/putrescine transport system ATPase subunit